ncbi:hypothetical protein V5N11_002986 [Cardamine amara subsp. amara]|uniref:DUF4283 domain-containing protein n=1 Tax=Cardamine amara subsp. amara TaxID=228776 RepID=A0ABD0ZVS9_CARAN
MSGMILDMPRVWRLYSRVRGVPLSNERFQFVFKYEDDLQEVLNAGAWMYDDWSMVLEKWVESPPADYLQILPIWIRLRNIPVNHYTAECIEKIAERVGVVKMVLFDPSKLNHLGFERVLVWFDISKALKNFVPVKLPSDEVVHVGVEYERVRKRCFQCKRLTHDKDRCPISPLNRQKVVTEGFNQVAARLDFSTY